jgi:predicted glutamine amidotransferase
MCRWVAYSGKPVFLEDFVSRPCQSLVAQSRHCREAKVEVNADGFGLGWYGDRATPGVFRDIRPAWSDDNLLSLAHQIKSRLFLAHVRASTGTATTRANCHPFAVGPWLFMHNGQVGSWDRIRRRVEALIPDDLFRERMGTTDSEALFLLIIALGLDHDPQLAVEKAIAIVEAEMEKAGITEPLKFTSAFTDGQTLYAVRYSSDGVPPTLYLKPCPETQGVLVASEPLDNVHSGWTAVAAQSFVTVKSATVHTHAFARKPTPSNQPLERQPINASA